jgi:cellulose biosynthesis protein BcsQ
MTMTLMTAATTAGKREMMTAPTVHQMEGVPVAAGDPRLVRTVLVANQKGGVGKSSIVTSVAALAAREDRRVLIVDADQQANATQADLGVMDGDRGRGLAMALQYAAPLEPMRGVRPGLDLIPGGPMLASVSAVQATAAQTGIDLRSNLAQALGALCALERYMLVLIDSGPGDAPLLDALLGTARYLVVPTRDDEGSLTGVELLAARYLRARKAGAAVQLLGVVLFDANPRATARNGQILREVDGLLEGSGARSFESMIRSDRAAAVDLRARHLTAGELVTAAEEYGRQRIQRLRGPGAGGGGAGGAGSGAGGGAAGAGGAGAGAGGVADRLWSRDPSALAADYQQLARELLSRIAAVERGQQP